MTNQSPTAVYVVSFSDGKIKFGLSKNVKSRMHTYKQECVRNGLSSMVWWACKPLKSRADAALIENSLRDHLRGFAIAGHSEWLRGVGFESVLSCAEHLRGHIANAYGEDPLEVPFKASSGAYRLEAA